MDVAFDGVAFIADYESVGAGQRIKRAGEVVDLHYGF